MNVARTDESQTEKTEHTHTHTHTHKEVGFEACPALRHTIFGTPSPRSVPAPRRPAPTFAYHWSF